MEVINTNLSFNSNYTKRNLNDITKIILHHSGVEVKQSVEIIHNYHKSRGYAGIGYHYYIRKDGNIYKGRSLEMVGAHCSGFNKESIGICLEGNFDIENPTSEQLNSTIELIKYLTENYNIKTIAGHKTFCKTSCPRKKFRY